MLQLAGYLPDAGRESGRTYSDADTTMQTYVPDTDSNIASSSAASAAFDASAGASAGGFYFLCMFSAHLEGWHSRWSAVLLATPSYDLLRFIHGAHCCAGASQHGGLPVGALCDVKS